MQMTFIRQNDLQNPQVRELLRAKRVVLLSSANRDPILAGVLQPARKSKEPFPPLSVYAWLSILSMAGTVIIGIYAVKRSCAKSNCRL
jgi:hypothetical protein